ncbi:hypothetical protein HRR83_007353 [Exophiala dermatitidis]|nr:hypothetical protein HRR75_006242 [Exophiala dermatitidis]KAJ4510328.1 hypothetical protein HRR74_006800 [Exophiala dermatitidis]KAJ4510738.1 hypothetical protein HRR73_006810 [Exophiala dermatitidis]KAJ4534935.1 hypothetical protein HRR76_006837 [Exophiala dermatitidis]KAJ4536004.1 hypothetical protein HRR77_007451 [Exophiala dermatitidis]
MSTYPDASPNREHSSAGTTAPNSCATSFQNEMMDKDVEATTNAAELSSADRMRPISDAEKQTGDGDAEAGEVKVPVQVNPMDPSQFPDGGAKAWTVVFGAACGLVVSFGWINCIGVFQEYYETHQLKEYSSQEVAWIPSLEAFMMFVGGLWVGRIYDNYGPRSLLLTGTFFHVFGLMMASISTTYYQFLLSQGVCSALGASMIFYPSMSAVVTWFFRRRALALGITASGSSLGGVIFPIMVERLIPQVGFGWTMRICAFLILGLMVVANLTIVSRIPPRPTPVRPKDFVVPFKEVSFSLLALGSFLTFLGLFLPFTFIIVTARARHVSPHLQKYLVSILNAASTFGRTIPPFYADRVGRFTVFLSMSLLCALITLCLWLPGSGEAATIVFAVLYGFGSGAVASILPACIAHISHIHQIGVRTGVLFSVVAIAVLIGSPIGGQLITNRGYRSMQGFSGGMLAAGFGVYLVLWLRLGGLKRDGKKV